MIEDVLTYWRTGGPLMPVLAIVSYAIWFFFLRLRKSLLAVVRVPREFEAALLRNLTTRSLDDNLALYGQAADAMSRAVVHVLRAMPCDRKPDEAFDDFQAAHLADIENDTILLSAFTVAAPLLGLLGTVIGMVATFRAVGGNAGDTAVQVSAGISQALITTQCGLVVAIPGLFGIARIARLIDQARVRLGECRVHLAFMLEGTTETPGPA